MQLFLRGIVLPFQKGKTLMRGIEELPVPAAVRMPVGRADKPSPIASLPEEAPLAAGQVLCTPEGDVPVVSPISGILEGTVVMQNSLYGSLLCADIQPEGERTDLLPVIPEDELTASVILDIAREAAVYDELDGSPLWQKLQRWQLPENDPAAKTCILVADATENDVYGSSAWAVLMEQPRLALFGLQMAARALRFSRYHIATMLPKRRRRTLKRAIGRENVYTVGDEYPVTVYADGDTEVYRIGIQACLALGRALKQGLRHTAAIVTVAGDGVPAARNMRVPFGTDLRALLSACQAESHVLPILGDAMTGVACDDLQTPILPGVTTVLAMKPRPIRVPKPCIGCGRCAAVCHAGLLPYEIVRRAENMHYERLQHLSPGDCDGCAVCSYVCPAGRDVAAEVLKAGETKGTMFLNWGEDDNE
ncbi:MAG: 4Fe-4S dicluster domain-containing protein [Clostridia bacterium]|nr:4Fe-4S dicluster domain-containing protein [Clostridia bacterium]